LKEIQGGKQMSFSSQVFVKKDQNKTLGIYWYVQLRKMYQKLFSIQTFFSKLITLTNKLLYLIY
jgi:hypothetical protein